MIKACIFDLDGTLADTVESIAVASNRALARVGLGPLPVPDYKYYAGDGAKTLIERALRAAGDEALDNFDQVYDVYSEFFEKDCTYKVTVFDGMRETLAGLKARGIKTAVLSNKPHARTLDVIHKLFGEGVFDRVQGQVETIKRKPDPSGALLIAGQLGVAPEECMYVGDTNVDMQTGNGAGMYTVGVLWGFRTRQELEMNRAHHIVGHPLELLDLADRKNNGMEVTTPVRLVVSDIDGTLIKSGQVRLEQGIVPAVNGLMDQGCVFAVASGRQIDSIQLLFEGCHKPLYAIAENGGHMFYDGRTVEFCAFSDTDYKEIVRAVRDYAPDSRFAMAGELEYYIQQGQEDFGRELEELYMYRLKMVPDMENPGGPVCKIAVYWEGDVAAFAAHFRGLWGDRFEIAVSGDRWIDFNPKNVDKGSGVRALQKLLGISPEETMVFGDNENDVPMLRCAGYSCVVDTAQPAARRAAAYETDSVLKEIRKLLAE